MANEKQVVSFGPGYEYDPDKTPDENEKAMKAYYAKIGVEIEELPEKDKEEIKKLIYNNASKIDKILKGKT